MHPEATHFSVSLLNIFDSESSEHKWALTIFYDVGNQTSYSIYNSNLLCNLTVSALRSTAFLHCKNEYAFHFFLEASVFKGFLKIFIALPSTFIQ